MANIYRVFMLGAAGATWMTAQIERRREARNPYSQVVTDGIAGYVSREARLAELDQ